MEVIKKYNQHRRDLYCDMKCESCGYEETDKYAYDDRNFWDNVIPNRKCRECGKSTVDLGLEVKNVPTRYSEFEVV